MSQLPSESRVKARSLIDLPSEILLHIFKECFEEYEIKYDSCHHHKGVTPPGDTSRGYNVLLTCKKIYVEYACLYYDSLILEIHMHCPRSDHLPLTSALKEHIRNVRYTRLSSTKSCAYSEEHVKCQKGRASTTDLQPAAHQT